MVNQMMYGQTPAANHHEAKFVVTLCLHLTSNKVPPVNVGIITPYKGQKGFLPPQQKGEELECEEVKFLEMTIYLLKHY